MSSKVNVEKKDFTNVEKELDSSISKLSEFYVNQEKLNNKKYLKNIINKINEYMQDLNDCIKNRKNSVELLNQKVKSVEAAIFPVKTPPPPPPNDIKNLKQKIKKLLAGGHYKKASKAYKKLQKLLGKKEAKSWMKKAIKSTNAKATIYGGAVVSLSKAIKSIKANLTNSLANNQIKKSNKYYEQLTKLLGKKKSKKEVEEIIKSTGVAACISSSKIKSIVKSDASDPGTNVVSADQVEAIDVNQLRDKAIEYIEAKNDAIAIRNSNKAVLYEKAAEKIEALDIKDPNYNQKVEEIKAQITEGCRDLDTKWEQSVDKLTNEYSKYGDGIFAEEEAINNNLESVKDTGFQNVLTGKAYSSQRLSDGEELFSNTLIKKQEEVNSYKQGFNNSTINNSAQNNTQSSNESVAVETPFSQPAQTQATEQKITYSKINSNKNNSPKVAESTSTVETPEEAKPNVSVGTNNNTVIETEKNTTTGKIKDITGVAGSSSTTTSSVKKSSGAGAVIPAILGVGAIGAAGVAGVRYVKNKKQNVDIDESYDDENNSGEYDNSNDESEYMKDDYLGPAGTEYMDASNYETSSDNDNIVPDNNSYTDAENLETDDVDDDDFSNDEAFNELN